MKRFLVLSLLVILFVGCGPTKPGSIAYQTPTLIPALVSATPAAAPAPAPALAPAIPGMHLDWVLRRCSNCMGGYEADCTLNLMIRNQVPIRPFTPDAASLAFDASPNVMYSTKLRSITKCPDLPTIGGFTACDNPSRPRMTRTQAVGPCTLRWYWVPNQE